MANLKGSLRCVGQIIFLQLILLSGFAFAAEPLPTGIIQQIDPGRTGEELTPIEEPPSLLAPDYLRLPPEEQLKVPAGAQISLTLGDIKFVGNKVFSNKRLAKFYDKYVGQIVTVRDVQNIAREITIFYRNSGYILTRVIIPPQEVDASGIITLQIVEGYIDNIAVEGDLRPATKCLLMAYARHIAAQRPLKLETLERYALLANDIPGAKVKTIIRASETTPGAADLVFVARQQRNNWYAGANNFSSEVLGREQMVGGVNANGYLSGSQTGLRGVLSFHVNRMQYFSFLHKQQLNSKGLTFDGNISTTITHPSFQSLDLVALQTPGQAFILNANATYPIIRSRKQNLFVGAGFNYLNSHTSYSGVKLFDDAIRSVDMRFSYNFFAADASLNTLEMAFYQGLNILDAHASPPTIPGGKTNFNKITGSINRYQQLPAKNCYLLLWAKGQWGFTQLLSSEKFGFGGAPFGYGYDPSTITGDRGYALKIEPQYNYQLSLPSIPQMQFFGFYDVGNVWNINKAVQPGHQSATSMGVGVRALAIKRLTIELILAQPFSVYATNNNKNRTRCMFNIYYNGGEIFA